MLVKLKKTSLLLLILFGGGLCLAKLIQISGVASHVSDSLSTVIHGYPYWISITLLCAVTLLMTEITSNVATISALLPIVYALAIKLNLNPLLLLFPVTLSASCAFMLPVATAPNAMAFSQTNISVLSMAKGGIKLNIVSLIIILFFTLTWTKIFI